MFEEALYALGTSHVSLTPGRTGQVRRWMLSVCL